MGMQLILLIVKNAYSVCPVALPAMAPILCNAYHVVIGCTCNRYQVRASHAWIIVTCVYQLTSAKCVSMSMSIIN